MEQAINPQEMSRRGAEAENVAEEHRDEERREIMRDSEQVIVSMKKIPVFAGFSDDQYRKILTICSRRTVPKDNFLCTEGEESVELFVLLRGKLRVTARGTVLGFIDPVGLIGEIGVFTGAKRSASVVAFTDCTVIRLHKTELLRLMQSDYVLSTRLLLNVISDLSGKLQEDNRIIEELRNKKRTMIL